MFSTTKGHTWLMLAAVAACVASPAALAQREPPPPSPEKQEMIDLAIEHGTAWNLYRHFQEQADGGEPPTWRDVPDWSGVWTREASVWFFDPDQTSQDQLPPAQLTPEYERRLMEKLQAIERGVEYDPLSAGEPAGMPRWFAEPFLRDFAVTPGQTWMINEMMNEVRRIYTDGRGHPPPEDAYPLWEGDSIGFWDDGRLIIHTSQMRSGQYQRIQPHYSEQVEVVEIWEQTDEETLAADVWIYDPPALEEPWYTRQVYKKLSNPDKSLRIRYWAFSENPNNTVIQTEEGTSQFDDFTFTDDED